MKGDRSEVTLESWGPLERSQKVAAEESAPPPISAPLSLDFALLRGALEEIPFGVGTTRGETLVYANEALTRIFGASHGGLEGKAISQLFDGETSSQISRHLREHRLFDGRVQTRGLDGREIDAEVHFEWYSSGSVGVGGFLLVRDVSLELGALGRLVDQLGGAVFRICVGDGAIEYVSPTITKLTGLSVAECREHPVLLTTLLSTEERDRLAFLYRRVANGEITVASAHVSLRRHDGIPRILHIRATPRRDTTGAVRHIDGVVTDATRETEQARGVPSSSPAEPRREAKIAGAVATGMMGVCHELLREVSQQLHQLRREVRGVQMVIKAQAAGLPDEVLAELSKRLLAVTEFATSASAINRSVRRALGRRTLGAPFGELMASVATTLTQIVRDGALTIDIGDTSGVVIAEQVDELTIALTHIAFRAYRFAGSGSLELKASLAPAAACDSRPRAWLGSPPVRAPAHLLLEIVAHAPADLADVSSEISSDGLKTIPHPADADVAFAGAQALLASANASIELDEANFSVARTVVRVRG